MSNRRLMHGSLNVLVNLCLVVMLSAVSALAQTNVMESLEASANESPSANPNSALWQNAPQLAFNWDTKGEPLPDEQTEVRSRWTGDSLYLLYICHYRELNLKPNPDVVTETMHLWKWDVAEAFIGSDFTNINHYKEFEMSPQGEWLDLDIDRGNKENTKPWEWQSGFTVKANIDGLHKVWCGEMRIPFRALSAHPVTAGQKFRINLFRAQGIPPHQDLLAWRPTNQPTFHVPEAFGELLLVTK